MIARSAERKRERGQIFTLTVSLDFAAFAATFTTSGSVASYIEQKSTLLSRRRSAGVRSRPNLRRWSGLKIERRHGRRISPSDTFKPILTLITIKL